MMLGCFFSLAAPPALADPLHWIRQLGVPGDDQSHGVSADGLGNVYIAGTTAGSLGGPSAGGVDAFISKYNAAGNLLWTRQLGTTAGDGSFGVSADALGNVYISGQTSGNLGGPSSGADDAFVTKYDAAGNLKWTRQLGSSAVDSGNAISADGLGNVFVAGGTSGSLGGAIAGSEDAFVGKYDAEGALQWTRQLGTLSVDYAWGASADGLGGVYINGYTLDGLGGSSAGGQDAFLARYDSEGTLQWTRQFGTDGDD
jgi:hypothetical protein